MSSSSSSTAKRTLASLRSKIFQTAPPPPVSSPGGVRTGSKILKAPLKGPAMLQYYNPKLVLRSVKELDFGNPTMFSNFDPLADEREERDEDDPPLPAGPGTKGGAFTFSELGESSKGVEMEDIRETQRLADVAAKKARGKGPPKKGVGRRAGLKGKRK